MFLKFIKGTDIEAKDTGQYLGAILKQSLSSENMVHCIIMPRPPTPTPTKGEGDILFLLLTSSALA